MKKILKALFCLAMFLIVPLAFVGCGESAGPSIISVELKDGNTEGSILSYEFNYKEPLEFSGLQAWLKYSDGTKVEMTEEQYEALTFSYTKPDGTVSTEFPGRNENLDAGFYTITISYNNMFATVNLVIRPIEADTNGYTFHITNKSAETGTQQVVFATGGVNLETNKYESDYTIKISKSGDLTKDEITGIYVLTENEYNTEFLTKETRAEQQEYLSNHMFLKIDEDSVESRLVTYNLDGPTNTEFYLETSNPLLKAGTYYMFTQVINQTNYNNFFTTPNQSSRFVVNQQTFSIKDCLVPQDGIEDENNENEGLTSQQLWNKLNLHAYFKYDSYWDNDLEQFVIPFGKKSLGFLENHYGIRYNDESNFLNHLGVMLPTGEIYSPFSVGNFEFALKTKEVDCTDNGTQVYVKFVLNDYFKDYYKSSQGMIQIPLTMVKGVVQQPYTSHFSYWDELQNDFVQTDIPTAMYDYGNDVSLPLQVQTSEEPYLTITGRTASAVGTYTCQVALRDDVNYEWDTTNVDTDNWYYGNAQREFTWEIVKRTVSVPSYQSTYNQNVVAENETVVYDRQHNTVDLSIVWENGFYDASYFANRTLNWEIVEHNDMAVTAVLDANAHALTNTLTFSAIEANDYVQIRVTAPADENFNAFVYNFYLSFAPAEITAEELSSIQSKLSYSTDQYGISTATDALNIYHRQISENEVYYLKLSDFPNNPFDAEFGSWKIVLTYYLADQPGTQTQIITINSFNNEGLCEITLVPEEGDDMDFVLSFRTNMQYIYETQDPCIEDITVEAEENLIDEN